LNIFVNTRLLIKDRLEGIGWFTNETLKRITQQHPEHHFVFAFDRKFDDSFIFSDNIAPVVILPPTRHPILYKVWFEYALPTVIKRHKTDIFLSPDGFLSLSAKVPSISVIHDINFEHYPADLPKNYSKYYRKYFPLFAKKASRIATVSNYSKNDIVEQYNINPNKIDVVYNGVNEIFSPLSEEGKMNVKKTYSSGDEFFIFVSALHPRKNIANLFKAYAVFQKTVNPKIKLLVVGNKKWWNEEIEQAYQSIDQKKNVIFAGRLNLEELRKVLGSALALTYVSYFEGFGIPIIEAFACGTPVITSTTTSMPEVAGDAALLVDPFSVNSICQAMKEVSENSTLRTNLIKKGYLRALDFTWQHSADSLWDCISKVAVHS